MAELVQESIFKNAQEGAKLSKANAKFALAVYRHIADLTTSNIFMSPLSISVALAMTYLGARNNTKRQMSEVLHFDEVEEADLHQAISDIRGALNKPDQPYKLYMANRLFGEQSVNFLEAFLSECEKYYEAKLEPVDFIGNSNGATALINGWIADNTAQKITNIIPPGALNSLTRLVLVNAVYFKGDWLKKFDLMDTVDSDFHISPTETVRTMLMYHSDAWLRYGVSQDLNSQVLELPYVGNQISMFVVLPDASSSLEKLESAWTENDFTNIEERFVMQEQNVEVWLPRFKLNEKLGLTEVLAAMGIIDIFDGNLADLSGIGGSSELHVSQVLHQALVDVTEEGTEAAAATAVMFQVLSGRIYLQPLPQFRADRPFMFFIRDNLTKSILFLGRFVRP